MSEDRPPSVSPLGRYDETGRGGPTYDVRLLGVPVRLFAVARDHHDDLLREFAVLGLAGDEGSGPAPPPGLRELVEVLGRRYAAPRPRPDAEVDAALDAGAETVDLTYRVPAGIVATVDRLESLMAEADEYCRQERLLVPPRPAEVVAFAGWYLEQFRRQVAGAEPQPWSGPLDVTRPG